jgi:hypothetical protein
MEEVGRREIRWYHFIQPEAINQVTNRVRTDAVKTLRDAGLVRVPDCDVSNYSLPEPTADGERWYFEATGEPIPTPPEGEGPGSTSPEPGPPRCPDYPDCSEERLVRDMAASVAAGEPVGRWTSGCAACGTLTKGGTE